MKKVLGLSLLFSFAATAGTLNDLAGRFEAVCGQDNIRYVLEAKFDAENNEFTIEEGSETSGDRYSFAYGYGRINEGKKVEKYDSETFGCAKRTEETTFDGKKLKHKYSEKKCFIPYTIHSHEFETVLLENGNLLQKSKAGPFDFSCELKRL